MNMPPDELDPVLLRQFAQQPELASSEEFLQRVRQRLLHHRRWATVRRLALPAACAVLLAVATPWIVSASQQLGRGLELALGTQWLWVCLPLLGAWPLVRARARR